MNAVSNACVAVLLGCAACSLAEAAERPLRVATFQVDVSPPIGSPLCDGLVKPAETIVDPLSARGIVLLTDEQPIVLCAVDWVGIGNGGHDAWRAALAAAAGTTPERVAVHTLHQHDAPGCDFDAEALLAQRGLGGQMFHVAFAREAIGRAAAAVQKAVFGAQPVTHLGLGQALVEKVASNRRVLGPDGKVKYVRYSASRIPEAIAAPEGVIDPLVRLVSFWNGDKPVVSITYYATHPQSYYGQGGVSADFVGLARTLREKDLPAVAHIHFNGASGNVAAGKYNDGSPENRPVLAQRLAAGMQRAWEATKKVPIAAADVRWRVRPVLLPVSERLTDEAALEKTLDDATAMPRERIRAARDLTFARRMRAGRKIDLTCLQLVGAYIVHMPGELFVEYQLAAQAEQRDAFVALAAYGDYGPGYIGTQEAYEQGGYETGIVSRTAPKVEDVLNGTLERLLGKLTVSRRQFSQSISRLHEGMTEAEVLAALGKPDDVRTLRDPGGISTTGTKEIWRYGTSGHLTIATLGQIYLDENGRVQYVYGKGEPPPDGLFEEQELRRLIDALGKTPSYNSGSRYNPRHVILAVNLLHPLGKTKALAAIDEFLRVASHFHDDGREGVFLVLRTLFEVPEDVGHMPPMHVGAPNPLTPKDPKSAPRFPIAIENDIPFLVVGGYVLGGYPQQPESHAEYFRKHGSLRDKSLSPTIGPFKALDEFAISPRWIYKDTASLNDSKRARHMLGEQVMRLLDSVYRVEPGSYGQFLPIGEKQEAHREQMISEASNLKIRWNGKSNQYTFLDGSTLPPSVAVQYLREIWKPNVPGLDAELIFERTSSKRVSILLSERFDSSEASPATVFKVFNVKTVEKAIVELRGIGKSRQAIAEPANNVRKKATGSASRSQSLELPEGTQIQVELFVGEKSYLSPILQP